MLRLQHFIFLPAVYEGVSFSTSSLHLLLCLFFYYSVCEMVSHCFDCISLMAKAVLIGHFIYLWRNVCSDPLSIFNWVVFFLFLLRLRVFIFWIQVPHQVGLQVFSLFFLVIDLWSTKVLNFQVQFIESFIVWALTFTSQIHFELFFVYSVRKGSPFILWHVAI